MWPFKKRSAAKTLDPNDAGVDGNRGWEYLAGVLSQNRGLWKPADEVFFELSAAEQEQAYGANAIVHAAISKLAATAAEAWLEVGTWLGEEWKPAGSHWLLDLLERPNAEYSRTKVIKLIVMRFTLTGCSYLWKVRNKSGSRVAEIWPLPTSAVTPIRAQGAGLWAGYRTPFQADPIIPRDMAKCWIPDPATTGGFISPLNAAMRDYRVDRERENYLAEMLTNTKVPSIIIAPDGGSLNDKDIERIETRLDETVGKGKRGSSLVLKSKGQVTIPPPLSDADWPGLTALSETRICAALGVPPILIGLRAGLERATYSNAEQAEHFFYRGTMSALWEALADDLTHGLLRAEGDQRLYVRFRYDQLPAFQDDADKGATRAAVLYREGLVSRDEGRGEAGFDPDPDYVPPEPPPPADNQDSNDV